ncbi:YciI family protein [Aeromicrobium sp. CTD01-1L150]|uniref:YciI family protein n=1 Tax=Aeromicrobium sp. CTD01-1L150 TaxID=3341830 RepID=UPI0035C08265
MAHFVVSYVYSAPESDLAPLRAEHRDYLAELEELVIAGPADQGRGGLLVLRADTVEQVEALVAADPFVTAGFVGERIIRDWKPVLGPLLEHV